MDGFNEKKWFVYLGDHHEGPFSMAEVQEKISQGEVSRNAYVWCEGMPDWRQMDDVTAFMSIAPAKAAAPPVESTVMAAAEGTMMSESSSPSVEVELAPAPVAVAVVEEKPEHPPVTAVPEEKTGDLDPKERLKAEKEAAKAAKAAAKAEKAAASPRKVSSVGSTVRIALVVATPVVLALLFNAGYLDPVMQSPGMKAASQTAGDLTRPYLLQVMDKVPAIGKWINPIPALEDVSEEDFEELKIAAMTPEPGAPLRVGIGLSRADLLLPSFYVASALPDGTTFDVYVEGVADTLLNHMSFTGRSQAVLSRRLGKSLSVKFPDGKPLPRGEYVVYVFESDSQPEAAKPILASAMQSAVRLPQHLPQSKRLIARKSFFLGGVKDANYQQRLKEYHERLTARAQAELNEVKQFVATLDSQLGTSVARFTALRRPRGKFTKTLNKQWNDFHSKWMKLDGQLNETFQKWTPEALQTEYFYGMLYQLTQQAGQAVERVHSNHHAYFTGAVDPKSYDIQLGESLAQAQAAVKALRAKIDQAEKIPPTPNGMPRKEGL